jgi:hypothetical protein
MTNVVARNQPLRLAFDPGKDFDFHNYRSRKDVSAHRYAPKVGHHHSCIHATPRSARGRKALRPYRLFGFGQRQSVLTDFGHSARELIPGLAGAEPLST